MFMCRTQSNIRVHNNWSKQTSVYEPATMTQHATALVLFSSQDDLDRTFGTPLFFQTVPEAERFGSGLQTEQGGLNLRGTDPEEHKDTLRWCSPTTYQSDHPHCWTSTALISSLIIHQWYIFFISSPCDVQHVHALCTWAPPTSSARLHQQSLII